MEKGIIKEKCQQVVEYVINSGYSRASVWRYQYGTRYILKNIHSNEIKSFTDIYRKYEEAESCKRKRSYMRGVIKAVEVFCLEGRYPDWTRNIPLIPTGSYHSLNDEYKAIIDCFIEIESKRKKQERTILREVSATSVFFLQLQNAGVERLAEATESDILSLFVSNDDTIIKGYSAKKKFAAVLKACIPNYPFCETILAYLPALKAKYKNIQYLTAEEIAKVKNALFCDSSELTLRDKAIGTIAVYMGLRSGDIAGLQISSIDWNNDTLCIKQQKTGAPLTLPLSAVVGNAVWDYMELERPKSDSEYVFISARKPFKHLACTGSMYTVAQKIMKVANIRQNKGDRQGFHIFRHYFATTLLGNGIPRPLVSNLTGQIAPESLEPYLSADFVHLKKCAISIERFPVSREVFGR